MEHYAKLFEQIKLSGQISDHQESNTGCSQSTDLEMQTCESVKDQDTREPSKSVQFSKYAHLIDNNVCDPLLQYCDTIEEGNFRRARALLNPNHIRRGSRKVRLRRKKKKALTTKLSKLKL